MNQSSQKTLIIVLIAAITVALGVAAGIYYGKTHPKQTDENLAVSELTTVSQTVMVSPVTTTVINETTGRPETEIAVESTTTEAAETTLPEEATVETQEEAPVEDTSVEGAPSVEESARDLPYITYARIVGEYNDFGAGYMFRLDLQGDYAYWTAEVSYKSPVDPYTETVSSSDLTPNYPYITGGSCLNDLGARITPYDENGNSGTPYSVNWNETDIEFHPSYNHFLFKGYVALDTATLNLRSHPYTDSIVFAQIPAKTQLDIYSSTLNGWYIVNYNGIWGYVSADYIGML